MSDLWHEYAFAPGSHTASSAPAPQRLPQQAPHALPEPVVRTTPPRGWTSALLDVSQAGLAASVLLLVLEPSLALSAACAFGVAYALLLVAVVADRRRVGRHASRIEAQPATSNPAEPTEPTGPVEHAVLADALEHARGAVATSLLGMPPRIHVT